MSAGSTVSPAADRASLLVRADLSSQQPAAVEQGRLLAPDGRVFTRRGTRMARRAADDLVARGAALVTYWPGGLPERTRVVWLDGGDAVEAWHEARGCVTGGPPRPPRGGAVATVGRWACDEDVLLVLTWEH